MILIRFLIRIAEMVVIWSPRAALGVFARVSSDLMTGQWRSGPTAVLLIAGGALGAVVAGFIAIIPALGAWGLIGGDLRRQLSDMEERSTEPATYARRSDQDQRWILVSARTGQRPEYHELARCGPLDCYPRTLFVETTPDAFWNCLVWLEDRDIGKPGYNGVSPKGVVNAVLRRRGGSTLPMQVYGALTGRPSGSDTTFLATLERKTAQWVNAPVIYHHLVGAQQDLDRFKRFFAQYMFFVTERGRGDIYGLEQVAQLAFGVSAGDLSEAQQLTLAAAIHRPPRLKTETERNAWLNAPDTELSFRRGWCNITVGLDDAVCWPFRRADWYQRHSARYQSAALNCPRILAGADPDARTARAVKACRRWEAYRSGKGPPEEPRPGRAAQCLRDGIIDPARITQVREELRAIARDPPISRAVARRHEDAKHVFGAALASAQREAVSLSPQTSQSRTPVGSDVAVVRRLSLDVEGSARFQRRMKLALERLARGDYLSPGGRERRDPPFVNDHYLPIGDTISGNRESRPDSRGLDVVIAAADEEGRIVRFFRTRLLERYIDEPWSAGDQPAGRARLASMGKVLFAIDAARSPDSRATVGPEIQAAMAGSQSAPLVEWVRRHGRDRALGQMPGRFDFTPAEASARRILNGEISGSPRTVQRMLAASLFLARGDARAMVPMPAFAEETVQFDARNGRVQRVGPQIPRLDLAAVVADFDDGDDQVLSALLSAPLSNAAGTGDGCQRLAPVNGTLAALGRSWGAGCSTPSGDFTVLRHLAKSGTDEIDQTRRENSAWWIAGAIEFAPAAGNGQPTAYSYVVWIASQIPTIPFAAKGRTSSSATLVADELLKDLEQHARVRLSADGRQTR